MSPFARYEAAAATLECATMDRRLNITPETIRAEWDARKAKREAESAVPQTVCETCEGFGTVEIGVPCPAKCCAGTTREEPCECCDGRGWILNEEGMAAE